MPDRVPTRFAWPALFALLALAWLAYWPGLSGGFLFDDFVNLDALGKRGPIDDAPAFWRYLTSGSADPTGRPLSLLSFLLDARDWPADPRPFLRTNVLLHLLNGALLFALLRRVGRHLDGAGAANDAAALLGAGLWLLHPLLVSTTLYVVQREAMLPATFVLAGLLAWVHGRQLHATRPRAGAAWMLAGIGLGTLLAVASKANGVLLPLFALVLEATVLRAGDGAMAADTARRLRAWRWALLVLPSLLLAAGLLQRMPGLHEDLALRPWTIAERVLTQPRVLLDYLQLLAFPRVLSTGLYNDAYAASTGLLAPPSTLAALLALMALLAAALAFRRRAPVFATGLLFWMAGHLLESTVLPLELYFEHRNYLPALLLFWPLARALCRWRIARGVRIALALGVLALLATATWQRASLWGQPARMVQLWAARTPESPRAVATAAAALTRAGRADDAASLLATHLRQQPHELQLVFNYANARCAGPGLSPEDIRTVDTALRLAGGHDLLVHQWLSRAIGVAALRQCDGMTLPVVDGWLQAALANPALAAPGLREQNLEPLLGELATHRGDPDAALAHYREALGAFPNPDFAARLTASLASHGYPRQALALLDGYLQDMPPPPARSGMARVHAWVLERQDYWAHEFAVLRAKLLADIRSTPPPQPAAGDAAEAQP